MSHDTVNNSNNNTGGAPVVIHKHHIIPRYRCKEIGVDPDFDENIIYITRLEHAMEHWRRFMIHGDKRDLGAAVLLARCEIDGLPVLTGENNPRYGKKHSPETKKKISESQMGEKGNNYGKTLSAETKKKMSEVRKGKKRKPFSAEWKKNISEAKTGVKHSDETRKKMSESQKGKTLSAEWKKNISESQKRRWKKQQSITTKPKRI